MAEDGQGNWVACLGWSAAARHLKDRESWIGWKPMQMRQRLHLVVNNGRFLVFPGYAGWANLASDLEAGRYPHVKALAQSEGIDESYVRRLLRLTLHSPKVIQDQLDGQGNLSSIVASTQDAPPEIWDAIPSKAI